MPDPAREIFESFRSRGALKRLEKCLLPDEIEDDWLDYKTNRRNKGETTSSELTEDTLKVFGKAAGAFANHQGGVIVWGIYDQDLKKPRAKDPLPDAHRFKALLVEHQARILDPPMSGFDHIVVPTRKGSRAGYVVTYVPKGPLVHMSKHAGTFHLRSGSNSIRMSTEMIRAMMNHRSLPSARLVVQDLEVTLATKPIIVASKHTVQGRREVTHARISFKLYLENTGPSLIENLGILANGPKGWRTQFLIHAMVGEEVQYRDRDRPLTLYTFHEDKPVYPGVLTKVAEVDAEVSGWQHLNGYSMRYHVVGRNDLASEGEVEVERETLRLTLLEAISNRSADIVIYEGGGLHPYANF
jgi:hypothetical protein